MQQETLDNYDALRKKAGKVINTISRSVSVSGLENILEGPGLITPNHYNWKDIPVLGTKIPRRLAFVCQKELLDKAEFTQEMVDVSSETIPFLGKVFYPLIRGVASYVTPKLQGVEEMLVPVSGKGGNRDFLVDASRILQEDMLLCIFPERRFKKNKHTELQSFTSGFARIAYAFAKSGIEIPVYPTAVRNTQGLMKNIELRIGEPRYIQVTDEDNALKKDMIPFIHSVRDDVSRLLYSN